MSADLAPICGAIKLKPAAFTPGIRPGAKYVALTCLREVGHPELDADSSLHLCGYEAWKVGPGDDYRETDEYKAGVQR